MKIGVCGRRFIDEGRPGYCFIISDSARIAGMAMAIISIIGVLARYVDKCCLFYFISKISRHAQVRRILVARAQHSLLCLIAISME